MWGTDVFSIVDGDEIRIEDGITRYDPYRKCFTVSAGYNGRIEKITTHSQNDDYTRDYQESHNYSHSNSYERQESSRFHVYTGKWSYLNFWERSDYVKETYQSQTIDFRFLNIVDPGNYYCKIKTTIINENVFLSQANNFMLS